jgi:hypothetical protein
MKLCMMLSVTLGQQSAELGAYVRLQVMQLPWIGSEKKSKELFFSFCYYRGQQKAALKKKHDRFLDSLNYKQPSSAISQI